MAGQKLTDLGNLQIRERPRKQGVYIAEQSYPDGVTPEHLESFTEDFSDAANECGKEVSGDIEGNDKVRALNACVAGKLEK